MNKKILEYKDYLGSFEYLPEEKVFYGKVMGVNGLLQYDGETEEEAEQDFRDAVDDYLEVCAENGVAPEKSFSGTFSVHISPDLHKKLAAFSEEHNQSVNITVEKAIELFVTEQPYP